MRLPQVQHPYQCLSRSLLVPRPRHRLQGVRPALHDVCPGVLCWHVTRPAHSQPLAPTVSHQATNLRPFPQMPTPPPPKPQLKPADPPLQRQTAKVTPPSPPKGGFARVYEARDRHGFRYAVKAISKQSLIKKKAKTKLYAEIKIHRSLTHPNIVQFQEAFEDSENVYMTLELCHNGSLMDMLRRRKSFTEPESRFFMVQLIGACHYMHNHQVIHRDLKLGNIMLDAKMNVKVGDFGLAALIENPGERKKTICGTPNYIAPEVLWDTANGHSFEVDTWSVGVILYTLVIGKPPFSTKDTKDTNAIYRRIRDNDYEFPPDRPISREVQDMVQQILALNPDDRPPLLSIIDHPWFTHGTVPSHIPVLARDSTPDFRHITPAMSKLNLSSLRKQALLDDDASVVVNQEPVGGNGSGKSRSASLAQQEKEFQKAVQPGSPISALLTSARQPLVVGPMPTGMPRGEQPLIRKLQAARSPRERVNMNGLRRVEEEGREEEGEEKKEKSRKKELESQKARIVAQMMPSSAPTPTPVPEEDEEENVPPSSSSAQSRDMKTKKSMAMKDNGALTPSSSSNTQGTTLKLNGFDAATCCLLTHLVSSQPFQLYFSMPSFTVRAPGLLPYPPTPPLTSPSLSPLTHAFTSLKSRALILKSK
ncbi:kinase-like domain-containing protein [Irpex lacteus]|nr:kinase-like domain-containing protein [Irpex lacteus]